MPAVERRRPLHDPSIDVVCIAAVFLCNRAGTRHIDASDVPLSYFDRVLADISARTPTAMLQSHPCVVSRLAIEAQSRAQRIGVPS